MKTIEELQKQLDQSESSVTRFEILKIMAGRAIELQKENYELKSYCEKLKSHLAVIVGQGADYNLRKNANIPWVNQGIYLLSETPQQSLIEIKANAIEEATDAFVEFEGKRNSTSRWIDDYADKLRKGEKDGK